MLLGGIVLLVLFAFLAESPLLTFQISRRVARLRRSAMEVEWPSIVALVIQIALLVAVFAILACACNYRAKLMAINLVLSTRGRTNLALSWGGPVLAGTSALAGLFNKPLRSHFLLNAILLAVDVPVAYFIVLFSRPTP